MKKTGELLKQKRESVNLSLSEVALATKINPKVLSAIEAGDESNLPAKTILKGFVRSYALFLKMDVEEVVRTFIAETGGPTPSPLHENLQKSDASTQAGSRRAVNEEGSAGLRTAAVVVIVLLIGLIIGIRELVDKYQREKVAASTPADVKVSPLAEAPTKDPAAKAEPTAAPADAESAKVEPAKAEPEKVAEEKPAPEPAPAPAEVAAPPIDIATYFPMQRILDMAVEVKHEPASTSAPEPVEIPVPPKPRAEAKVEPKADEAKPEEPKPAEELVKAAPMTLKNEVIIEALDKVDVKFQLAGESKSVALAPNEVQVIRADGAVTMDFSDGGAVSLVHNGRMRGVPGKLGEPKQVKFQ